MKVERINASNMTISNIPITKVLVPPKFPSSGQRLQHSRQFLRELRECVFIRWTVTRTMTHSL